MHVGDFLPFPGKSTNQVIEYLIGTVGHDNPTGIKPVQPTRLFATRTAGGIGIFAQIVAHLGKDRLDHPRRRRIRVFVGIEP